MVGLSQLIHTSFPPLFPSPFPSPFYGQDLDVAVSSASREPWVYMACGHVYSRHDWKAGPEEKISRTCPLCRVISPYCKLDLGLERGFFIDGGPLTHAFVPCGHVTTEKTTK